MGNLTAVFRFILTGVKILRSKVSRLKGTLPYPNSASSPLTGFAVNVAKPPSTNSSFKFARVSFPGASTGKVLQWLYPRRLSDHVGSQ